MVEAVLCLERGTGVSSMFSFDVRAAMPDTMSHRQLSEESLRSTSSKSWVEIPPIYLNT